MQPCSGNAIIRRTQSDGTACWFVFTEPVQYVEAQEVGQVWSALEEVDRAVLKGMWAVGGVSFEAGRAFDRAFPEPRGHWPLVWFALYDTPPVPCARLPIPVENFSPRGWAPLMNEQEFIARVNEVKAAIALGETYQVNLTFPLQAQEPQDGFSLFLAMNAAQPAPHGAWLDLGARAVASASPELFFHLSTEGSLTCRPMKGTSPRGRHIDEDTHLMNTLAQSEKNRAENIMIVDMVRNDMGRVAETGTVATNALCRPERYRTVWQLTSTVTALTPKRWHEVMAALFPCASITGAPKVQTLSLIQHLEPAPREWYTGCVGSIFPDGSATFNVAIRTALIDRHARTATLGVGAGIVWDSDAAMEYRECLQKSAFIQGAPTPFRLLETMRWDNGKGFYLWAMHRERMAASARYFGFPFNAAHAATVLQRTVKGHAGPLRVRLLLDEYGEFQAEAAPLAPWPAVLNAVWDDLSSDTSSPFLFHKTTHRRLYDSARQRHPNADEVLLWNERGEAMEFTNGNLAVQLDGTWFTPPIDSGLLDGTLRRTLVDRGEIKERILSHADVTHATTVQLINSVRGRYPVRLASGNDPH